MLRNINFFNIKPDANEEEMLSLINNDLATYANEFGCIERRVWKLLDYHGVQSDQPGFSPGTYINESIWPSQKEADAFSQSVGHDELNKLKERIFNGVDFLLTLRYVDVE